MNNEVLNQFFDCACSDASGFFQSTLSLGDIITYLLTIIGLIVAIYQFNKQMKEARSQFIEQMVDTRQQAETNQRQTWFLNVIIVPQIDNIKTFYNELQKKITELRTELKRDISGAPSDGIHVLVAKRQNECKAEINSFYDHFSALVSSSNKQMGTDVINIGNKLEDICTELIESYNEERNIKEMLFANEQQLFTTLNQGMV